MKLTWRHAILEDVPILAEMNAALIEDESGSKAPLQHELRLRLHSWLSRREYHAVLFESPGTDGPAAYALWQDRGNEVFLRHFFVQRERRRRGIGRRVLELLEHDILPSGRRIILEVLESNARGRGFWSAMGYQPYALTLTKEPAGDTAARD